MQDFFDLGDWVVTLAVVLGFQPLPLPLPLPVPLPAACDSLHAYPCGMYPSHHHAHAIIFDTQAFP